MFFEPKAKSFGKAEVNIGLLDIAHLSCNFPGFTMPSYSILEANFAKTNDPGVPHREVRAPFHPFAEEYYFVANIESVELRNCKSFADLLPHSRCHLLISFYKKNPFRIDVGVVQ